MVSLKRPLSSACWPLVELLINTLANESGFRSSPLITLPSMFRWAKLNKGKKVVCIGGMKELGKESFVEHQTLIDQLMQSSWEQVILVGNEFKQCTHPYLYFDTVVEAKSWLDAQQYSGHTLLIKGSRGIQMEQLIAP